MKTFKRIISLILTLAAMAGFYIPADAATGSLEGWNFGRSGSNDATAVIDNSVFHSGGSSVKFTRKTPQASNVYYVMSQWVSVEAGKRYRYGFWAKAKNISGICTLINWEARAYLNPVVSTYDWTYFTFQYEARNTGSVEFKIIVDEPSSAFWVDDMEFYEYNDGIVGSNKFKNPGFEGVSAATVQTGNTESGRADEFAAEDFYASLSTSEIVPVYKKNDIVIDGDISDWKGTTKLAGMPKDKKRHIQKYSTDVTDAVVDMSFAYDENYLYFLTEVEDNVYYEEQGSEYWRGDSIQLCISQKGESFGAEIGYNYVEGSGGKYALDFGTSQMDGLLLKTVRNGNKTYYESAIPWDLYYKEFKDEILFSAIYNDNDGGGRKYAIQISPGIAEGKVNSEFPVFYMVPEENDFFAWCEGESSPTVFEENEYNICVLNNSDADKTFKITARGETKEEVVPANTGKKVSFDIVFEKAGKDEMELIVSDGECEQKFTYSISAIATPDYYDGALVELQAKADEINELIKECKEKGIPTAYEEAVADILGRWGKYIKQDAKKEYYDIMEYTFEELERMYVEAKENLTAYLSGEKTAIAVPKYVSGDIDIDGVTHWADTVWSDGTEERRPVFFIGYNQFWRKKGTVADFAPIGNNAVQTEFGVNKVIGDRNTIPGYSGKGKNFKATWEVVKDKSNAPSGSHYLKITSSTPRGHDMYNGKLQGVSVEPNTTYEFGCKVKATNAKGIWLSMIEWPNDSGRKQLGGDYAWKNVIFEHTTGPKDTSAMIQIMVEDINEEVLIDDLFIRKKGSKTNLLKNPGFETAYEDFGDNKRISMLNAEDWIEDVLAEAEKNNIAVSVLLSPHYWPTGTIQDEIARNLKGNAVFATMKSDETKEILEKYLEYFLPEIGKYKSLANICITNEPTLDTQQNEAYFHDDFVAYLKDVYSDNLDEYNRINGTSWASFDEIKMPTGTMPSILLYDWKMYNDTVYYEWNKWMAEKVHEILPDIPVHFKIMQPVYEDDAALRVHIRYGSNFEYYADVSNANGCDAFNYYNPVKQPQVLGVNTNPTTTDALEKFFWYDTATSHKYMPVYNTEDHVIVDNQSTYNRDVAYHVGSDAWQGTLHGRGFTSIWHWERSYTDSALLKGVLTRPDVVLSVSKATLDANRLSYEISALADEAPRVGLMWSDTSRIHHMAYLNSLYKTYESTVYSGLKAGIVSENVLERMHNYDVFICPSVLNIKKEKLYEILEYAKSGKTLVLLSKDSLKYDEHNQPHDEALVAEIHNNAIVIENKLDGAKMTEPTNLRGQLTEIFDKHNLRRVRIVDAETGLDANMIEYMYTEYEGKLLLNMVLYDWSRNQNVKVLVDGKPVTSALELRSMTNYGESFELKTCQPILLQIDLDGGYSEKSIKLQIDNSIMTVDGKRTMIDSQSHDTVPVIVNDRTLMPVRAVVEAIGGEVSWNGEARETTLKYSGKEIKLTIDSITAYADGAENTLDVAPQIINDRTMLPLRFIAENFGLNVDWDGAGRIVTVTK